MIFLSITLSIGFKEIKEAKFHPVSAVQSHTLLSLLLNNGVTEIQRSKLVGLLPKQKSF
jgi:hypothetical protein